MPCTSNPGGIFLRWLMLRLMIHLHGISGSGLTADDRKSATAAKNGAMLQKDKTPFRT